MMLLKKNKIAFLVFLLTVSSWSYGQEDYYVSQSKFMQKANPSYFGVNQLNRIGVLYSALKINENTTMDNKYLFGSLAFPDMNFTLGIDVNSFNLGNPAMTINTSRLAYVYTIQLSNYTYFLPSLNVGLGSQNLSVDDLIFYDQLDNTTGFINTQSTDPLAPLISNSSYFDLGASFLVHSEDFIVGLDLKHLNKPNTSFNKEVLYEKPIEISLQGGYEFNINPYEFRYLPRYSYLFLFGNFRKSGDAIFLALAQDFQLGEFSLGLSQQASSLNTFALNNVGLSIGLSLENFDFGVNYNFPMRSIGTVYSPSIFEISVIFDFSIYRRNNRGLYKRLQTDNYY